MTLQERFQNGEWCDANEICELLGITFADGLKMFDFSRTAEWCKPPFEGQKITCKFKMKGLEWFSEMIKPITDKYVIVKDDDGNEYDNYTWNGHCWYEWLINDSGGRWIPK